MKNSVGAALQKMRSAMVHGIVDERGSHDCLYVTFSATANSSEVHREAMAAVLPYIDTALRQVTHLPHQQDDQPSAAGRISSAESSIWMPHSRNFARFSGLKYCRIAALTCSSVMAMP